MVETSKGKGPHQIPSLPRSADQGEPRFQFGAPSSPNWLLNLARATSSLRTCAPYVIAGGLAEKRALRAARKAPTKELCFAAVRAVYKERARACLEAEALQTGAEVSQTEINSYQLCRLHGWGHSHSLNALYEHREIKQQIERARFTLGDEAGDE